MNRFKKTLSVANPICSFFLFTFIFFSCGKSLPTLDGIDLKSWHEDKNGCSGKRLSMKESIIAQREKLLALEELQIVALLGKPDQNELSKRNQKFYYYYLQSAKECSNSDSTITPKRLAIRFNAMGLAKEVQVE
jgi:hypothetical protein